MADHQSALPRIQDSLLRRMRTMFSLYHDAVDTMDLDHVNHVEAEGRLPIAFSLYHYVNIHDATFMGITGQLPIWNEDWQDRVQVAIAAHGKDRPVSEMANQRIGNYDAFKDYQRAVFDRTEHHLATMDPADFGHRSALPTTGGRHLQRPLRRPAGHYRARRLRVLALPTRVAAHG